MNAQTAQAAADRAQSLTESLPADFDDVMDNFAPVYSDLTLPVPAGTYCTHNGVLYRANTTIASGETWTAGHWTRINVGGEIGNIKASITQDTIEETLLRSDLPGTTVSVTFDSNGNPATITHTSGGNAVRTDVFTWGDNTVTEVRTASSKKITITTNLTTLAQTVSDIEEVA